MSRPFTLGFIALLCAFPALTLPLRADAALARTAAARGDFAAAAQEWLKVARTTGNAERVEALLQRARSLRELGQHRVAMETLAEAEKSAKSELQIAAVKAARGATLMFSRQASEAEELLRTALASARRLSAKDLTAQIQNDLGILLSGTGDHAAAARAFDEAAARGAGDLSARAKRNLADAWLAAGEYGKAKVALESALHAARALPEGHERVFLLLGLARICERLFLEAPEHEGAFRRRAFDLDAEAAKIAAATGDERALAWALGHQGALYEMERKLPEALALTRRALALAQRLQAADSLHRWQAQSGRILARQGERDAAIEAYRRAVLTLEAIRNDVAIRYGNRNAGSSYRKAVGAVYYELADLLLQRADGLKGADQQATLHEARAAAESLKSAELEDYFQDDCVNLLRSKQRGVESLSQTAAVLYILPLPSRTEILVSLPGTAAKPGRIERFKSPVGDAELTEKVRSFRVNLENRTTNEFLEQAQQLHTLLIAPVEATLGANRIDTLVFVPDGALRTVPMAALHDGAKYLVEKYAIAVTPGLELMEAGAKGLRAPRMMINGLTDAVQEFPPLPAVQTEVERLATLYPQNERLMNGEFVKARVTEKFSGEPFTIVHIASHGHIDSDVRKSFVLTHSEKLTLDDLERLIRPGQLADKPLELLTLKTKAIALQNAQRRLLADPRYAHPCYWAPYLIIGNWL